MGYVLVKLTLEFWLIFGVPALVLAVCCLAFLPRWPRTFVSVLVVVEIGIVVSIFSFDESTRGIETEMAGMPGSLIGVLVGNLLAIPIARSLRSLFNRDAAL